ncbi:MAG TPA: DNA-3-methyladenine glycosylase I [Polyangia bacterium]|jgi:DNA-3-methyladenine glycosylase I|nr:DNA-3-methyladenine glycosylase I [Polyangia bacterium]
MIAYHDLEWGVPVHDDRKLFELITLEGAQAGLSWSTILHKREGYRAAFAGFDPARVARYGAADVTRLMKDAGIVRNRLKIESTIDNARAVLELARAHGSFDAYLSSFLRGFAGSAADPRAARRRPRRIGEVPAKTPASDALSVDLKKHGFRFVGSTIIYAFMQATGLVDDHLATCFRARAPRRVAR